MLKLTPTQDKEMTDGVMYLSVRDNLATFMITIDEDMFRVEIYFDKPEAQVNWSGCGNQTSRITTQYARMLTRAVDLCSQQKLGVLPSNGIYIVE